jgi:hypothetical protein
MSAAWIADEAAAALRAHAADDLDAKDELALTDLIAAHLEANGHDVQREVKYPSALLGGGRRGARCDLVTGGLWVEVKRGAAVSSGGPDDYAPRLIHMAHLDVVKLATDGDITHAVLLAIIFDEPERAAQVANALTHHCLDDRLPVSAPITRTFPITDWRGNESCTVVAFEVGTT